MEFNLKRTKKELIQFLKEEGLKVSAKMKKQELLEMFEKHSLELNTTDNVIDINEELEMATDLLEANKYFEKQIQTFISPVIEEHKQKYDMKKIEAYLKSEGLSLCDFSFKKQQQRIKNRNRKYKNLNLSIDN